MADTLLDQSLAVAEEAVHAAADPRQTLLPMLEGLSRALGYRRGLVALYDRQRGSLRGTVGANIPEAIAEALEVPLEDAANPLVVALRQGMPVRVDDVHAEPRLGENANLLADLGIDAFVVAPLRSTLETALGAGEAGSVLPSWNGVELPAVGVVILSKDEPITDGDIEQLMPFATQAGTTLQRVSDAERLRDSSERFGVENEWLWWMINAVADPVVVTDENNDIILPNRRAETLFRANADDSEGKRRALLMNNVLFTAALSTSKLEQGGSEISRPELTLIDPIEGTELLFEVILSPATNYRLGGTRGMVSVLKNITELREATVQLTENVQRLQTADEEIRLERDRLDLLLRSVPNPIVLIDNTNQIVTMNPEAMRLLQAPQDAVSAARTSAYASNDTKFQSFVAQLRLDQAQSMSGEITLTDPETEEQLPMAVTSREVRDDLGSVIATVSVMQDVSRLRELERRRLERVLFESEKLAATGRLAASIAHEINNPLEAIKNALYILNSRTDEESQDHKFLQIATKEMERVSRILKQMLDFYRPAKMERTDVTRVIEEAESLIEKHLRQRRVRVLNDLSESMPLIIGSADQLKQVILNLLLNAQEAMPDGGDIYVTTRSSREAGPGLLREESVQITVRDTGAGIAEENQARVFEPFFTTKTDQKGTGLGLWVSYGIIQSHGGSIRVRSREGRGTTFTISLPVEGPAPDVQR